MRGPILRTVVVTVDDVRHVVGLSGIALVVEAVTIGLHVVKPNVLGASRSCFGENQDGRAHPCIRLEHPAGHAHHRLELVT